MTTLTAGTSNPCIKYENCKLTENLPNTTYRTHLFNNGCCDYNIDFSFTEIINGFRDFSFCNIYGWCYPTVFCGDTDGTNKSALVKKMQQVVDGS